MHRYLRSFALMLVLALFVAALAGCTAKTQTKTENGGSCVVGCHVERGYDRNKPVQNR